MAAHLDLIVEIFIFCTIAAITWFLAREFERAGEQRRRLGDERSAGFGSVTPLLQRRDLHNRFFQWVQASTSISDAADRQKLRGELSLAGFNSPSAPVWYVIIRFVLAIGLPLLFVGSRILLSKQVGGPSFLFGMSAFCGIGFLGPSFFVRYRASARRMELEIEFPDALDLMVVCVEAGLSLDAAFIRVGDEIENRIRALQVEFARLAEELRAGRSRAEALRAMADRCNSPGIRSFVALVVQTDAAAPVLPRPCGRIRPKCAKRGS